MTRRRVGFVALLASLLVVVPGVAQAAFTGAATASGDFSTDTMAPPTAVSLTTKCSPGNSNNSFVTLVWTATADTYPTGYVVTIAQGTGTSTLSVAGRTTTTQKIAITQGVPYTFSVATVYLSWTAPQTTAPLAASCP